MGYLLKHFVQKNPLKNTLKSRWKTAKSRFLGSSQKFSLVFLLVALASGAYIYQNVVYKKNYLTPDEGEMRLAAYEKQLKQYEGIPQPKYTKVKIQADLFPMERDAYFSAEVELVNKTNSPIDSIHFNSTALSDFKVILSGDTLKHRFPLSYKAPKFQVFGKNPQREWYKITALPKTMMPGDTLQMTIVSEVINTGFPNSGYERELVYNGSFFSGGIPDIGYDPGAAISSDEDRRKYDLPEKPEDLPPHNDPKGRSTLLFVDDADFIQFEAVVSTVPSQIAVAPGYLQKEWEEGGRRYFHYIQDTPIQCFFTF